MPYSTSNKKIQDSAFKLKSGNTSPFKQMGASPLKQDYVKDIFHKKYNPSGTINRPTKKIYKGLCDKLSRLSTFASVGELKVTNESYHDAIIDID